MSKQYIYYNYYCNFSLSTNENKLIKGVLKAFIKKSDIFISISTIFYTFTPIFTSILELLNIYLDINPQKMNILPLKSFI